MNTSRRKLLLTSFSGAALALTAAQARASHSSPQTFDKVYDVIVVGSGVAGTIAAIAAAEKGSKVLLIEKMNRLGGTSRFSGLNFACVGSQLQKEKGVKDSPELLANDMFKVSNGLGNYELALNMAQNTARVEKFLTDRGVVWDGRLLKLGGHSVPRCLVSVGDGAGLMEKLWTHMKGLPNLDVLTSTKAEEVLFNDQGRVNGLVVKTDYKFNPADSDDDLNNHTGSTLKIKALQGVVFATGGYARDRAFRSIDVPFLKNVSTTTSQGATAGALKTLVKAGARPMHLTLYRFAYPLPTEDMIWGILIDPATSQRFMSEGESRNTLAEATLSLRLKNGDKKPFMVYDEKGLGKFHNMNRVGRSLNGLNGIDGTMYKFNSIEELAKHYGADPKVLKSTLEKYNQELVKGEDQFHKPMERSGRKVEPIDLAGPFYGIVISPRLNYTPGGIRTNKNAQALSMATGEPIPGLYVCGEAAGGLHGAERMTACSMPDCSVYGLIAGEQVSSLSKLH